jgi:hypothetical protein
MPNYVADMIEIAKSGLRRRSQTAYRERLTLLLSIFLGDEDE